MIVLPDSPKSCRRGAHGAPRNGSGRGARARAKEAGCGGPISVGFSREYVGIYNAIKYII